MNPSRLFSLFSLLLVASVIPVACGYTTTSTTTSTSVVSFSQDIQPIFNSNCVICHQGASAPEELILETGISYQHLVNVDSIQSSVVRVAPGNSEKSYLWHKLNGTQKNIGGTGLQMPYGAPPLQINQINMVQQWIGQGALDN